mgnify:CR=1 FL=1
MKVIDCFTYFDEDMMLEIRLATLFDYVDKFVVCEATLDHAGKEKKLNFNINKFKKYEKKIEYIVVDDLPKVVKSFKKHWHTAHARDQLVPGQERQEPQDKIKIPVTCRGEDRKQNDVTDAGASELGPEGREFLRQRSAFGAERIL